MIIKISKYGGHLEFQSYSSIFERLSTQMLQQILGIQPYITTFYSKPCLLNHSCPWVYRYWADCCLAAANGNAIRGKSLREYKQIQKPGTAVARSTLSLDIKRILNDKRRDNDQKVKQYVNALHRYATNYQ